MGKDVNMFLLKKKYLLDFVGVFVGSVFLKWSSSDLVIFEGF